METTIVQPLAGTIFKTTVDGIEYQFFLTSYENIDGYAKIMIHDITNDERYLSEGYFELNNHVFISKWKAEYSDYRDNWICSKDLVIIIQ